MLLFLQSHVRDCTVELAFGASVKAPLYSTVPPRRVSGTDDFSWIRLPRFFWCAGNSTATPSPDGSSVTGTLQARIADVAFEYQNEFVCGAEQRLVITPLVDRVFLAMALAVGGMKLGCTLIGPAASGKASMVRCLGSTLGAFVVVTSW
jgi:hypothetical protein